MMYVGLLGSLGKKLGQVTYTLPHVKAQSLAQALRALLKLKSLGKILTQSGLRLTKLCYQAPCCLLFFTMYPYHGNSCLIP